MRPNYVDGILEVAGDVTPWLLGENALSETVSKDYFSIIWNASFEGTLVIEKRSKPQEEAETMIVPVGKICDDPHCKETFVKIQVGSQYRVQAANDFVGNIKVRIHSGRRLT